MTRTEFDNEVCWFGDLYDFCVDNNLESYFDDIEQGCSVNDRINEFLEGYVQNNDWRAVRNILDEIDGNWDGEDGWYRVWDWTDFCCLGDYDFDQLKAEVRDDADANDLWDEEEPEEEEADAQASSEPTNFDLYVKKREESKAASDEEENWDDDEYVESVFIA